MSRDPAFGCGLAFLLVFGLCVLAAGLALAMVADSVLR